MTRIERRASSGLHHKGVVIVVEDDVDLLHSVEAFLEKDGYLVLNARNGLEALARMRGISRPCVAVLDLLMPGMDGWQLVRAMKADPNLAAIPIVTCSAHVMEPVEGTQQHLRKPILPETLLVAVRAALSTPTVLVAPVP